MVQSLKYHYLSQGWSIAASTFARISCCVFLLGFVSQYQRHRWPLWIVIGIQTLINAALLIIIYGACGTHLSDIWEMSPNIQQDCWVADIVTNMSYVQCSESPSSQQTDPKPRGIELSKRPQQCD